MNQVEQILAMVKNRQNPSQMIISLLQQQAQNSPMGQNLLNLAQTHNAADIEKIARNICQQKGLDFDTEFTAFKKTLGL